MIRLALVVLAALISASIVACSARISPLDLGNCHLVHVEALSDPSYVSASFDCGNRPVRLILPGRAGK